MAWYNSSWGYAKKITIDNTKVAALLTDFAVLVSFTDVDFRHTGSGGHVGKTNGGDILFTSADGTTKLKHEIQKYVDTSGLLIAWVKIPSLLSSSDTDIYVYYGNAAAADQADPTNVWDSDYEAVYHLQDDEDDSTGNNRDGTNSGSVNIAAKIGDGQDFEYDDTTDNIDIGNWNVNADEITIQAWFKAEGFQRRDARILDKGNGGNEQDLNWMASTVNPRVLRFRLKTGTSDSSGTTTLIGSTTLTTGTWYHFNCIYDGSDMFIRFNKIAEANVPKTGTIRQNAWQIILGNSAALDREFDGILDEVRISKIARSNNWLDTEYNNQDSPSTFYTVGAEEIAPVGVVLPIFSDQGIHSLIFGGQVMR